MKRLATLLAGLVLVSGMSFAEMKWDFKGTKVDFEQTLMDSKSETMETGDEIDFILKVKTDIDENTKMSVKYDTDDSNPDNKGELLVTRKVSDYITAQVDLDLKTETGFAIAEDEDSDKSYIEFKATDAVTLKFLPLNMDLNVADEFETTGVVEKGGVEAKVKLSDALNITAGLGTLDYTDDKLEDATSFQLKAGVGYEVGGLSVDAMFSTNTQASAGDYTLTEVPALLEDESNKDKVDEAQAKRDEEEKALSGVAPLQTAISVMAGYEMGALELNGEVLMTTMNTYGSDESGTAIFVEAAYSLGEVMEGIKVTPYGSFKSIDENVYFDDDDSQAAGGDQHGGLTVIEAGAKFKNKGLTVKPYVELSTAENKIYGDDDSRTVVGTVVEVKF